MDPNPLRSPDFWIGVAIALVVKIKSNKSLNPWQVATTMFVAIGAAWIASGYAADVLNIPEAVSAALVTLTAEGLMRWLLLAVNDPKHAIDLWKEWRK